jgi:hypothetical protein
MSRIISEKGWVGGPAPTPPVLEHGRLLAKYRDYTNNPQLVSSPVAVEKVFLGNFNSEIRS